MVENLSELSYEKQVSRAEQYRGFMAGAQTEREASGKEAVEKLLRDMYIVGAGIKNEKFFSNLARWISKRDARPIEEIKRDIRGIMGVKDGEATDED